MTTKKKIVIILSAMSVCFFVLGFFGINGFYVFAEMSRLHITAEDNGYVVSEENFYVDTATSLTMSFNLPFVLSLGEEDVGFFVVDAGEAVESLTEEKQATGYAVLTDKETSVKGDNSATVKYPERSKAEILKSGCTYKITFDNSRSKFVLERKLSGSNLFSVIQEVENLKKLPDGEYVFGMLFPKGYDIIVDGLEFLTEEKILSCDDTPQYDTELTVKDGGAFTEITGENGKKVFYANKTAIDTASVGETVVSVGVSMFSINNGDIGFTVGTSKSENGVLTENAIFYSLNGLQGINKYLDADFTSSIFFDEFIDANSIFMSGRKVKAKFNFDKNVFTLLVCFSESEGYKEVFTDNDANFPSGQVFVGLQIIDNVQIKMSDFSVYIPSDIKDYAISETQVSCKPGEIKVVNSDGRIKYSLLQSEAGYAPSKFIYTTTPVTLSEGESIIAYMKNVRWTMESPNYYQKSAFVFANSNSYTKDQGFYLENVCVSMEYELSRSTCRLTNDADMPADMKNQMLSTAINFYTLFKDDGNSIMAVFSPELDKFSLYMKSAVEPDYTVIQTFTVPEAARGYINNTLYFGFEMYGGMSLEMDEFKVYTAKNSQIAVSSDNEMEISDSSYGHSGGFIVETSNDAYVRFDDFTIGEDYDCIALEYSVEKVAYTNALFSLGFFITDGDTLPTEPELINRAENNQYIKGKFIEGDKSDFYAFIASDGLTQTANDKMRNYMFHTGYSVRALFSLKNRTVTMQYKPQEGYAWNDVAVYNDLKDYTQSEKVKVALMIEKTTQIALRDIRAYTVKNFSPSVGYSCEGGVAEELGGDASLYVVNVFNKTAGAGNVYIDEEEHIVKTAIAGTTICLVAEPNNEYVFEGWYLNGKKVSDQPTHEISVTQSCEYYAHYDKATLVVVNNGADSEESTVKGYYKCLSYIGLNPQIVSGYELKGWTVSYKVASENDCESICEYFVGLKKENEGNLLSDVETCNIWKTVKNNIAEFDTCSVVTDEYGTNVISFGMFSIIDRVGYENGSLIINLPEIKSEFDEEGNALTERYVEITAEYQKKETITDNISIDAKYGDEYYLNYKKTVIAFFITAICTVAIVAVLIIIKKRITKK